MEVSYGIEWREYSVSDLFEIKSTLSFNKDSLTNGHDYDYVTRTSQNQGVLQTTGFVNEENINSAKTWSLGLLQMDFFYRSKPWYAGQFVRKIIPKFEVSEKVALYFTVLLNKKKASLLSVLVRDVDSTFLNMKLTLPVNGSDICFEYIIDFIDFIKLGPIEKVKSYITENNLYNLSLTIDEENAIKNFNNIQWKEYSFNKLFDNIIQGRRLKKDDQIPGELPFVMSGTTNTGVVDYIGNDIRVFPKNSLTIDIFGNVFYRNYSYGQGDDTGAYWNDNNSISQKAMLYISTVIQKSLEGKFDYGNKLRSSQTANFKVKLPTTTQNEPDYAYMEHLISAVQKSILRRLSNYLD